MELTACGGAVWRIVGALSLFLLFALTSTSLCEAGSSDRLIRRVFPKHGRSKDKRKHSLLLGRRRARDTVSRRGRKGRKNLDWIGLHSGQIHPRGLVAAARDPARQAGHCRGDPERKLTQSNGRGRIGAGPWPIRHSRHEFAEFDWSFRLVWLHPHVQCGCHGSLREGFGRDERRRPALRPAHLHRKRQ